MAVYDFGGGTFDAAVLRKTDDGFELLGTPEGMERVGGIDFDRAVFAHVDASLGGLVGDVDASEPTALAALARLRDDCRAAKEALSTDTDTAIPVMLPHVQTEVRLTRPEFEAMIAHPRRGQSRGTPRPVIASDPVATPSGSADLQHDELRQLERGCPCGGIRSTRAARRVPGKDE